MTRTTMLTTTRMLQRPRLAWTMTNNLALLSPVLEVSWSLSPTTGAAHPTLRPTRSAATLAKLGSDDRVDD